jgi:hypothetical protein
MIREKGDRQSLANLPTDLNVCQKGELSLDTGTSGCHLLVNWQGEGLTSP